VVWPATCLSAHIRRCTTSTRSIPSWASVPTRSSIRWVTRRSWTFGSRSFAPSWKNRRKPPDNSSLRQKNRAIDPKDVVPAQQFLRAIEQLGIAAPRPLERELLHPIGWIGRRVAQDIENLLLPGDLIETRVLRR